MQLSTSSKSRKSIVLVLLMPLSWHIHTAQERDRDRYGDQMESKYHVEIFTLVQDRGRNQDPLFPIIASPMPCSDLGQNPVQCE